MRPLLGGARAQPVENAHRPAEIAHMWLIRDTSFRARWRAGGETGGRAGFLPPGRSGDASTDGRRDHRCVALDTSRDVRSLVLYQVFPAQPRAAGHARRSPRGPAAHRRPRRRHRLPDAGASDRVGGPQGQLGQPVLDSRLPGHQPGPRHRPGLRRLAVGRPRAGAARHHRCRLQPHCARQRARVAATRLLPPRRRRPAGDHRSRLERRDRPVPSEPGPDPST